MRLNEDIEVEKKLLSALMIDDGVAIPQVVDILKPDDFSRPEHRLIYNALLTLSAGGVAVNVLLVERELKRTNDLRRVNRSYLFGLVDYEYTTARVKYYADTVKRLSNFRRLGDIGRILVDEAENERHEPSEIQAQAEQYFSEMNAGQMTTSWSVADLVVESFRIAVQEHGGEKGLATPFLDLDKVIGGLKKTDLVILAARPSMGKTALALNMAAEVAKKNHVLFFSLEMGKKQVTDRLLCSMSRVDATRFRDGNLDEDEKFALMAGVEEISKLKLRIDETSAISLNEVRRRARKMKTELGLDLIVIDYLQLMAASKAYQGNRVQEVSELSRGLKSLAKDLDVPVLALSQLSRGVELRAEKRPQLSDLRESGSIEQDADIVMFLYREEYYDKQTEHANIAEVNVAKNRNGETKRVALHFEPKFLLFSNLVRDGGWIG